PSLSRQRQTFQLLPKKGSAISSWVLIGCWVAVLWAALHASPLVHVLWNNNMCLGGTNTLLLIGYQRFRTGRGGLDSQAWNYLEGPWVNEAWPLCFDIRTFNEWFARGAKGGRGWALRCDRLRSGVHGPRRPGLGDDL
ncbi:hypothetical protein GGR50DRAFT_641619, partial [Xylaria sp. CBS 124048]